MERPNFKSVKDPLIISYIEHLEKITDILTKNSRASTYVALRQQLNSWNEQITIRTVKMPHPEDKAVQVEVTMGYIDLFADKDSKEFDRVWKYMEGADEMEDRLHKMAEKLNPVEKEQVAKLLEGSSAERHVFNKV